MRIICVDDHPIILRGLTQNVQQILPEATVCGFGCAEDALSFISENGCEILVSEIEFCGTDGLTLAEQVKNHNPQVHIIFYTVCDEKEHAREILQIKPSGYLVKPAKKEQLALAFRNLPYSACAVG